MISLAKLLALLSTIHHVAGFIHLPAATKKPLSLHTAFVKKQKIKTKDWVAENTERKIDSFKVEWDDSTYNEKAAVKDTEIVAEKDSAKMEETTKAGPKDRIDDGDAALRLLSSELGIKHLVGDDTATKLPPLDVIFDRTLDTVEDAMVHLRRIPYDLGWVPEDTLEQDERPTVVVLGSGWASHAFLKVADNFNLRVIVVSPSNHFVFTPMLASAAVGTVEYRSMTEAVRAANPMIDEYVEGKAVGVDVDKKTITVKLNSFLEDVAEGEPPTITIPYDTLLVSVGTQVADRIVPGAREYGLRLKSCDDARKLRTAVGESFEYASRPDVKENKEERSRRVTFIIVGGGPTGVEMAGELSDFCRDITKPRVGAFPNLADDYEVILVHGGPELLPPFEANLRHHALDALKRRDVEVRLNTRVQEVGDGFVRLMSKETKEEEVIPVGLTVWAAGNRPVPFVDTLLNKLPESARGEGGRIEVDKWMRCPTNTPETFGSILVLGDAACFTDKGESTILPQTAQVAGQQGAYAARLLNRGYALSATPPALPEDTSDEVNKENNLTKTWLKLRGLEEAQGFNFLNLGLLAYVGGGEALSQVQVGDVPVFSYAGSVAFVLWRSVYLVKQVATRNRILVTFDWIKSALFGRDITRL